MQNLDQPRNEFLPSTDALNRRQFLTTTAASVTAATVAVAASSKLQAKEAVAPKMSIIDAHSHIWTPDLTKYPLQNGQTVEDLEPRSFTPAELMAIAAPHGVTKVVLIQHNIFHGKDNSYITDTIQQEPGKYSGVACIDAAGSQPTNEMDRLRKLGIRGLRIRPGDGNVKRWRDSEGMRAMWKHGPKIGVAMCPLINPEDLAEVHHMCQEFPETTVVVDHFARIGVDGKIRKEDVQNLVELAKFPKTNVKVSAFYALGQKKPPHDELIPMIEALYHAYGPSRLMWASDCPYQLTGPNTYGDSIALIKDRIDFFTESDKDWILRETAQSIFFS